MIATPSVPDLTLFHYEGCPYCRIVRQTLAELAVDIEQADIQRDARAREELRQARGRTTVPVLRIRKENGQYHWLPESADIIRYLKGRFGVSP